MKQHDDISEWVNLHILPFCGDKDHLPDSKLPSQKQLLSSLIIWHNMSDLPPWNVKVLLLFWKKHVSISCFHLAPSLHAAFTNPTVFNPDSVTFDPQNPSANMCEEGGTPEEPAIGDCNTTDMFRDAENEIKLKHGPKAQMLPLELWID